MAVALEEPILPWRYSIILVGEWVFGLGFNQNLAFKPNLVFVLNDHNDRKAALLIELRGSDRC